MKFGEMTEEQRTAAMARAANALSRGLTEMAPAIAAAMDGYVLVRYEVRIARRGAPVNDEQVYLVWADSHADAAFQAGATHVAEGRHAADMEVVAIRSEDDAQ